MEIAERINDLTRRPQDRGDDLLSAVERCDVGFDFVLSLKNDPAEYVRSAVAKSLGMLGKMPENKRKVYSPLLSLACDGEKYVSGDAILSMGDTRDSRFTFAMINFFKHAEYERQKRIFLSLKSMGDPRAVCFLKDYTDRENDVGEIARKAYSACMGGSKFEYSFAGREELFEGARNIEGRILLSSSDVLDRIYGTLERHGWERPQSYVVDTGGRLWIGGLLDEHVWVAKGENVAAAGEIHLARENGIWNATYINNRSYGYLPDPLSFPHISNALQAANINCDLSRFSETFPREGFCDEEFLSQRPFYSGIGLDFI